MADPKQKPHYINNKEFSLAVVEYVTNKNKLEEEGKETPKAVSYTHLTLPTIYSV